MYKRQDNPFPNAENPTALPEIWAFGLRNPWKFSFDKSNGDLWIADVGQSNKEEMNKVSSTLAGLNYGWRCFEGTADFNNGAGCPDQSATVTPVAEYNYGGNPFKCAITGGYRYRGTQYGNLNGLYFFADYCSREIGYLTPNQDETSWTTTFINPDTGVSNDRFAAFGEDINGEIYVSSLINGRIYQVVDETLSNQNFKQNNFKIHPNPASKYFTIQASSFIVNGNLTIYNVLGKRLKSLKFEGESFNVDINDLNKGIYLIELSDSENNKLTKKLIIN